MHRIVLGLMVAVAFAMPAAATIVPFPESFRTHEIATNGTTLYVRVGGRAPRWYCCTALATPATCGSRWRRSW